MKLRLPHTLALLFAAALLTAVTSCRDDHEGALDEAFEYYRADIVTYMGTTASGEAEFTLLRRDDAPAVTLLASTTLADDIEKGRRVMLSYEPQESNSDAARQRVTALALSKIVSDSLRVNNYPLDTYSRHPVRMRSVWRTADYLNFCCQLEMSDAKRSLYLMADRETVEADTVHAYLIHDLLDAKHTYHWRDCYASIAITALIKRPNCKVLRMHVVDEAQPEKEYYDFKLK